MQKIIIALLCCAMLILTVSCNKEDNIDLNNTPPQKNTTNSVINEQYNNANTEKNPMESEIWINNSDDTDESIAMKMYKKTLYDFMNGITPFETVDWILNRNPELSFTIVDMNRDGFLEVIVYNLDSLDNFGEHLVLHYISGELYLTAAQFGSKGMYNINKDGTFAWNQSAGTEYGAAKLKFDGRSVDYIVLYTIRNDGTDEAEFFIGDQKVTLEELDAFSSQFSNERAEFYKLTEENIEKYITLEIFNQK